MTVTVPLEMMPPLEREPEPAPFKTIVVRYGFLRIIGEFASDLTTRVGCGTKLVCRTDRGTELAEMLTTTCENSGCSKSVTREQIQAYVQKSGANDFPFVVNGKVLRVATAQDLAEQARLDSQRGEHLRMARALAVQQHLPMKIVDIEYMLGQERVLFYFTSEQRVDFRQLVRDMAHAMHARIELRQVGARDDARLTADYEKCGQHCCCRQFLKVLTPISMRAAKVQKATLDPAKISGRCGRLMCCLRYEDQMYEELRKKLPKRNTRVKTEKGDAWVIDGQILTQLVLVQYDDGTRVAVPMEGIQGFDQPRPKLPDGRTMQGPNDRMPEGRMDNAARSGPPPRRGPGGPVGVAAGPVAPAPAVAPVAPVKPPVGPGVPSLPQQRGPKLPQPPGRKGGNKPQPPAPKPKVAPQQAPRPTVQQAPVPQRGPAVEDDLADLIADALEASPGAVKPQAQMPKASSPAMAAPVQQASAVPPVGPVAGPGA